MNKIFKIIIFVYILLIGFTQIILCKEEMVYIYNAPESSLDVRYQYQWAILQEALEKTRKKYGEYRLEKSKPMTEIRQVSEMLRKSNQLTVMYLDTKPELEQQLIPVRIPVDKNLAGYRIFMIRGEDKDKFKNIETVNGLRKFTYGLGLGWIDVEILRANRFKVVTGSSYEGLFEMLVNKRFDIFLRSVVEVLEEYNSRKQKFPDLYLEENILLYYPLPMYFWFQNSKEGKKLAERVREGMLSMIEDGSYDRIFYKYQHEKIEKLKLSKRKIFKIENPYLVPETPFKDKRLWYDPLKD